jgi:GNAT superfamily N-acetyltransferase
MIVIDNRDTKKLSSNEFEAFASPVDTKYFGVVSAKVVLKKACLDPQSQDELLGFLQNFEFVTIINRLNDSSNNRWLGQKSNAFLTDINMQLRKNVTVTGEHDHHSLMISDRLPEDGRIIQIAETSFEFSRFLNDPFLPPEKARRIYGDITKNAFGKAGRFFVLFKTEDVITGFLLFSMDEPALSSRIELVAIDQNYKSQGIGRSLINAMESYVRRRRINTVAVGTQLDNIGALKFYTSMGFSYYEHNSIYHYWPFRS